MCTRVSLSCLLRKKVGGGDVGGFFLITQCCIGEEEGLWFTKITFSFPNCVTA
jgi:hypothetical protein